MRSYLIQRLAKQYIEHDKRLLGRENGCTIHDSNPIADQDMYPCDGRNWYYQDRIEESIYRLGEGENLLKWGGPPSMNSNSLHNDAKIAAAKERRAALLGKG
jgi:hypothetical protein